MVISGKERGIAPAGSGHGAAQRARIAEGNARAGEPGEGLARENAVIG